MLRKLTITDSEKLKDLLDKVTLNLLAKDILQWQYPWDKQMLSEDINKQHVYGMFIENQLIGTFSVKKRNNAYYLYRVAIAVDEQKKQYGKKLLSYLDTLFLAGTIVYLDCFSGNIKLKQFYEECGFKYVKDEKEKDYYISIYRYEVRSIGEK